MPPADNTNTNMPEPPKQGFWAKLFGKKSKAPEVPPVAPQQSQTPPPQLDTPMDGGSMTPPGTDVTTPNGTEGAPELDAPVPTVAPEEEPQTLDVPGGVSAEPTAETGLPPTLPTQPEADGEQLLPGDSSNDSSQTPPQQ